MLFKFSYTSKISVALIFISVIGLFKYGYTQGEDVGYLEFKGTSIFNNMALPKATISLFKNGNKISEVKSSAKGKFKFNLEYNNQYEVRFSCAGYVSMFATISTKINKSLLPLYAKHYVDVPFYDINDKTINANAFEKPFNKVHFIEKPGKFVDDIAYLNEFTNLLFNENIIKEQKVNPIQKPINTDKDSKEIISPKENNTPEKNKNTESTQQKMPSNASKAASEKAKEDEIKRNKAIKAQFQNNLFKVAIQQNKKEKNTSEIKKDKEIKNADLKLKADQKIKIEKEEQAKKQAQKNKKQKVNSDKKHLENKKLFIDATKEQSKTKTKY